MPASATILYQMQEFVCHYFVLATIWLINSVCLLLPVFAGVQPARNSIATVSHRILHQQ